MQIKTEQDMIEVCNRFGSPFKVTLIRGASSLYESTMVQQNKEMISQGKIGKNSHLQQGVNEIAYIPKESNLNIIEVPYLYPSARILAENPELTGPMTGVLVNCYDPETKRFLFHMRGTNIANPFGFQAAAAGMGVYGQHPSVTAALELQQEAGLENFMQIPRNGLAIDMLPFMKSGKVPQPLFSFGFLDGLSQFPVCSSLEDIAEFESIIKKELQEKTVQQKEAYHFTVPCNQVEKIIGELDSSKRFYGPVYASATNFFKMLKDNDYFD